jgi:hypothetical protein
VLLDSPFTGYCDSATRSLQPLQEGDAVPHQIWYVAWLLSRGCLLSL